MNIKEALYSLALFDSMNGIIEVNSGLDVEQRIKKYAIDWRGGFEFSTLFDSNYYVSQNEDIDFESISPLEHYLKEGHFVYNPSHFFDTKFYREKYSMTLLSDVPIVDYVIKYKLGERASRNPSPYFDVAYYLQRNKDVANSKHDPLVHFLCFGTKENRKFHPFLSLEYVRKQLDDDGDQAYRFTDESLIKYLIDFNLLDRYDPSVLFSNKIYRESVDRLIIKNPFYDFLCCKENEWGNPNGFFDTKTYISLQPTVNFYFTNPLSHYICFANASAATSNCFNGQAYLEMNDDVTSAAEQPLEHFLKFGFNERRCVSIDHKDRFVKRYRQQFGIELINENSRDFSNINLEYIYRSSLDSFDMRTRVSYSELITSSQRAYTIDFWDTLVFRESPHWTPKLRSAVVIDALFCARLDNENKLDNRRLTSLLKQFDNLGFQQEISSHEGANIGYMQIYKDRINIEAEFHKNRVEAKFESVIGKLFDQCGFLTKKKNLNVRKSLINYLRVVELNYEISNTSLNVELLNLLKKIVGSGEKIIVISDYYHDAEYLRAVLDSHLMSDKIKAQFEFIVSSEHGVSKLDDGKLFEIARKRISKSFQKSWIHFGDNPIADVRNAYKRGISSVFLDGNFGSKKFDSCYEPSQISSSEYEQWASNQILRYLDEHLVSALVSIEQSDALEVLRNGAIKYASIKNSIYPIALVLEAVAKAYEHGDDVVIYLSREGKFLCRVHEEIWSTLPVEYQLIKPVHAETSRRSLFSPAFAANEKLALSIFASQYPDASIYSLLKTICSSEGLREIPDSLRNYFFNTSISVLRERNLLEIVGDELYFKIVAYCENQNLLLKKYFANKDIFSIQKTALICDIGWRGTMQDLLKIIYSEVDTVGVYLGLFPFKIPQFSGTKKIGLIFDGNKDDSYSHVDPPAAIERPWTPNIGSCVSYGENSKEVFAICDESDCTDQTSKDISLFQEGVLEASQHILNCVALYGIPISALRPNLKARLSSYYTNVSSGISEIWFDSSHDDTFGSGFDVYKKIIPNPKESVKTNFLFLINQSALNSKWTNGFNVWSAAIWYRSIFS
ncbi:MAG: hypothetical protein K2Y28_03300 [Burkholderiaceae bacterium]|nr:hypothetical protein [Burkholderiaceae bacterium]